MVLMAPDHPLARCTRLTVEQLEGEPPVQFQRALDVNFSELALDACPWMGFKLLVVREAAQTPAQTPAWSPG